ncbi:hypothetical protein [Halalkalibacterium ligniniphilum]|uniref:hypothetical protein n=1 Tax=Halalkalibacterium ligniniphilum TaxID=1134413 RepID=UPI000363D2F1|nr:hypothetical protein [Halalkalibacterium ligniniphilum]
MQKIWIITGECDEISTPESGTVKIKSVFSQIEDYMSVKKANFKWGIQTIKNDETFDTGSTYERYFQQNTAEKLFFMCEIPKRLAPTSNQLTLASALLS